MMIILLLGLIKTFFFLRLYDILSPIVTMITNVIYDLRIFLLFYGILTFLFSLMLGILGVGNLNIPGKFKETYEGTSGYPGEEYEKLGMFMGNVLTTLRMSMGDFSFSAAIELNKAESIMYWFTWMFIVLMTSIIFLNFLVAEACASYEKVAEALDAFIYCEKASLIQEAEEMRPIKRKNQNLFPQFIVVREIEH